MYPTLFLIANGLIALGAFSLTSLQPVARRVMRFLDLVVVTVDEDGEHIVDVMPLASTSDISWRS